MSQKYRFPEGLYADIRIEENCTAQLVKFNGELVRDKMQTEAGALIRVYDGKLWYTTSTNELSEIQKELDALAELATPNPDIFEDPALKLLEVNTDERLQYEDRKLENIERERFLRVLDHYAGLCEAENAPEKTTWAATINGEYLKKSFYSAKGSAITYDYQLCSAGAWCTFVVDGQPTEGGRQFFGVVPEDLFGNEDIVKAVFARYIDYAKNAVPIEPGEYTCILSPIATAMFAHESFGQPNHGYVPYDDEGTKARETKLITNGVLTGRLHDSNSAATLAEELTGNCRAQDYGRSPVVRMTNTFLLGGKDSFEDIVADTKDGIYVYAVSDGTGNSTFVLNATVCYRIRDGKICEPVRVRMLTGSVFQTLFDIDRVGSDFTMFNEFVCGKMGQSVRVSAGGPSIRVKKLQVS